MSFPGVAAQFGIIAYDHEQLAWSHVLTPASPSAVTDAKAWLDDAMTARGRTNIMTPLLQALKMLRDAKGRWYGAGPVSWFVVASQH